MAAWYAQDAASVADELNTDIQQGLSQSEVNARLDQYGPNELEDKGMKSPWAILAEQFTDAMVLLLIVAAVVSGFIGEVEDTIVIVAIVVLNAILGFSQEWRAENAIAELKKLAVPSVRVRRGGQIDEVPSTDLVPGDVVLLESGNIVPADGRVVESSALRAEEAALTGESEPVEKQDKPLADDSEDVPIGDRKNMVFRGTTVTYGRGEVLVTETGMKTEIGNIANLLSSVGAEKTPLQNRLDRLGKNLAAIALGIIVVIFVVGFATSDEVSRILAESGFAFGPLFASETVRELFLVAISMAVAAVPEGLPAMVTIALALGSQRMLKRESLIRKLPAVETLGSVTTICSDKTGTLTQNRMTVTVLDVAGERDDIDTLIDEGRPLAEAALHPEEDAPVRSLSLLLRVATLANDSQYRKDDESGEVKLIGDPTETAIIAAASKFDIDKRDLEQRRPRVAEIPFTSERKRMTTIHEIQQDGHVSDAPWGDANYVACSKGAVDVMLDFCDDVWLGDDFVPLDNEMRQRIQDANASLAENGQRVLGVAFRPLDHVPDADEVEAEENHFTFIGLIGMIDPPRDEVKVAVERCRSAGIRPIMITGDHPLTAQAIAREIGIMTNDQVRTGRDLAQMSEQELKDTVADVSVYARVSPEHKLRIVEALQEKGQVVAMTGDGVNDAPALKRSDIGVAMGITGTDVSKEAADMVLLDDNFATIVAAVEEGRTIYDNLRKFIKYTLGSNVGELFVMLIGPLLGMPIPLVPIQILWINLVTDGLPGLALAVEKSESGVMERSPISPKEGVFARGLGRQILYTGLLIGIVSLAVGYWGFIGERDQETWRTMLFTTLTLAQMGNALAIRSNRDSLFSIGVFSNRLMVIAVAITFALQMALIYVPFLHGIFDTTSLSLFDLLICLVVSVVVFLGVEAEKWWRRRR